VNASGFVKALGAETEGSITSDVYTHSVANTDAKAALWIQQDVGSVRLIINVLLPDPVMFIFSIS
jgi:hypothetical protein